jgi:hypothetical protein
MAAFHNVLPLLLEHTDKNLQPGMPLIIEQIKAKLLQGKLVKAGDRLILLSLAGVANRDSKRQLNSIHVVTMPGH